MGPRSGAPVHTETRPGSAAFPGGRGYSPGRRGPGAGSAAPGQAARGIFRAGEARPRAPGPGKGPSCPKRA